jgi:hypothetical protein
MIEKSTPILVLDEMDNAEMRFCFKHTSLRGHTLEIHLEFGYCTPEMKQYLDYNSCVALNVGEHARIGSKPELFSGKYWRTKDDRVGSFGYGGGAMNSWFSSNIA